MDIYKVITDDDLETFKRVFKYEYVRDYLEMIGEYHHCFSEKIFKYLIETVDINTPISIYPCCEEPITHFISLLVYNERDSYLKIIRDLYENIHSNIDLDIEKLLERNYSIDNYTLKIVLDIFIKDENMVIELYEHLKKTDEKYLEEDVYKIFKYKYLDLKFPDSVPF